VSKAMAAKKFRLEEEAVSDILIADNKCFPRVAITNTGQRNHPHNSAAVCSSRGQSRGTMYKCARCDVGLCMVPCLAEYHTKVN
jgi:hypothetical protein